jgi:hypothetical protein
MRSIRFGWLVVVALLIAACAPAATPPNFKVSVTGAVPSLDTQATKPGSAPTPATTSASSVADAWKTYHSDRLGYTVDYPATWKIGEHVDPDGADVTTFSPSPDTDGTGVTAIIRNGEPADQEIPDMPNTRCQQVTVGELSGTRCFDTIAFSTTTTFVSQGRVYILASSGKRLDQNIYQRFLSSFTIKF